jgi:hypothetical protein
LDKREGYFASGRFRGGALNELHPLPAEILGGRVNDGFTYPVVVYDHDEGRAVTDGFAYHGRIAAKDKFVFGAMYNGRVLVSDLAAMKGRTMAFRRRSRRSKRFNSMSATPAASA